VRHSRWTEWIKKIFSCWRTTGNKLVALFRVFIEVEEQSTVYNLCWETSTYFCIENSWIPRQVWTMMIIAVWANMTVIIGILFANLIVYTAFSVKNIYWEHFSTMNKQIELFRIFLKKLHFKICWLIYFIEGFIDL
jgi:hypothetical protein